MKHSIRPLIFSFAVLALTAAFFGLSANAALAAPELVKSKEFKTVYYIDPSGVRHPFPDETTYRSWYNTDYSKVVTVSNDFLATVPIGPNITIRPGTWLVKIRTAPDVYTIEQGGVLRKLTDESIAQVIYGKAWAKRVVDVPDVFFDNYTIGKPINHDYLIPDGIVYQDTTTGDYFYKNNNVVRPFATAAAITTNNYHLSDVVFGSRSFAPRQRPIVGFDHTVFNPVAQPLTDRRDCENKKLKAAVIFVVNKSYTAEEIDKIQAIKQALPGQFSWATDQLASIDLNFPTSIMIDDSYLIKKNADGTVEVSTETINSFYDNNPDQFDLVFVWTNFKIAGEEGSEIASFTPVSSRQDGGNKANLDRASVFGSTGKLKGVIMMGNIHKYAPETKPGLYAALNIGLHEILHTWAAYVEFIDPSGARSKALLRPDDYQHWSYYAGFISPLGGSGWIDNHNGTFSSGLAQMADTNLRPYSPLDLYLMGLIPAQLMPPIFYVEPATPGEIGNTIKGTARWVTVDQLIQANGPIACSAD